MSDPLAIVERGYDAIAETYASWGAAVGSPQERFFGELVSRLRDGAAVLEIGCGTGETLEQLSRRFEVTGVDLSREQLRRAEQRVPAARLIHGDACALELAEASLDAVVSFYVVGHVPRERHATLYRLVAQWLRPGGLFLTNMPVGDNAAWVGDWLGAPMFFSSWDAPTNTRLVAEAGLELLLDEVVTMREPEGEATFQWILARR